MEEVVLEEKDKEYDYLMNAFGVYHIYKGKEGASNVVALRGINLELKEGEFVAIVGPSGSGKSTLMRCIGGLQHLSAGSIFYQGKDITKLDEIELVPFRRQTVGFVFQEGNLLETLSGFQNVVRTLRYAKNGYTESRKRAKEVLSALGLENRMHDLPHRLSGGERQRVSIARALANNPKLVIADEPTGNIDHLNTENVMGIFRDLHNDLNTAFLIVTHSQHVASYADRSIELRDGRFTGQHGDQVDVHDLVATRAVIINYDGSLSLPPEMTPVIEQYGSLWNFHIDLDNTIPKIIGVPSKETITNCPVCKFTIDPNAFVCSNCGAKLRVE